MACIYLLQRKGKPNFYHIQKQDWTYILVDIFYVSWYQIHILFQLKTEHKGETFIGQEIRKLWSF